MLDRIKRSCDKRLNCRADATAEVDQLPLRIAMRDLSWVQRSFEKETSGENSVVTIENKFMKNVYR